MDNNFVDKGKLRYEDIEAPIRLDEVIEKSLKSGKRYVNLKKSTKIIAPIAASFLLLFLSVNYWAGFASAMEQVPFLSRITNYLKLDSGYENAYKDDKYINLNKTYENNGYKLTITSIVGDRRRMVIGYKIDKQMGEKLWPSVKLITDAGEDKMGYGTTSFRGGDKEDEEAIELISSEVQLFPQKFLLKFSFGEDRKSPKAVFEVPMELSDKMAVSESFTKSLEGCNYETNVGTLVFKKLVATSTTIDLFFTFKSDGYEYMSFKDFYLQDDKGSKFKYSSVNFNGSGKEYHIQFNGGLKADVKSLKLICDGMYYMDTKDKYLTVDLKNKEVKPNVFGFKLLSWNKPFLTLKTEGYGVDSVCFGLEGINENGKKIKAQNNGSSHRETKEGKEIEENIGLTDMEGDNITLEISWILKDKTKPFSINLIK